MIVKHSEVPIDPDGRAEALALLEDLAVASRNEAGVLDYRITEDLETPNVVRIIERYESAEAAKAHEASGHLAAFEEAIDPYLAGESVLVSFVVTDTWTTEGP